MSRVIKFVNQLLPSRLSVKRSACRARPAMAFVTKFATGRSSTPWMLRSLSKAAPLSKATCKSPSVEAVSTAAHHSSTTLFISAVKVVSDFIDIRTI